MNKKLSAKVQQINTQDIEAGNSYSSCIVIEPEDKETLLKKGAIYGVFSLATMEHFDINLVKKIINDVIYESYFHSDSVSPIQSLEKSILDVKEKITNLVVNGQDQNVDFNILCGALWGNVLYVVIFGECGAYLVRKGEIRSINTVSEGNFSAASGMINDNDVVIFGTKTFSQKYPPDKLLSMEISEQMLSSDESGLLLKFIIDTSFTKDEIVDFGIENIPQRIYQHQKTVSNSNPRGQWNRPCLQARNRQCPDGAGTAQN